MDSKLSVTTEKNADIPKGESALNTIKTQMKIIVDHSCILPFEAEPSDFQKILLSWQLNKDLSEENDG